MSESLVFFHTDTCMVLSLAWNGLTPILGVKGHSKAGVLTGVLMARSHPVRKQVHV